MRSWHRSSARSGFYISGYNRRARDRRQAHPVLAQTNRCGDGNLDFRLTSVVLSLTTTDVRTASLDAGATISTGTPLTVDLNASGANATTNSQKLEFGSAILRNPDYVFPLNGDDPTTFQLANTLGALQRSLLKASASEPCFDASRSSADPANTFTIGFIVKKDRKAGGGIGFEVVKLGGSYERSVEMENTITVTFRPDEDVPPSRPAHLPVAPRKAPGCGGHPAGAPRRRRRPENLVCQGCRQIGLLGPGPVPRPRPSSQVP